MKEVNILPAVPILTTLLPLISILIATIARFAIRIFMKVFDWSTEIFFGKIPIDKSRKLTVLSALSMIWIIMVLCIPFPNIAKITLAFLPKAVRTNRLVIYLLNGSGALFIPIIVGFICIFWDMQINIDIVKVDNIKKLQYKQGLLGFYYTFFLGISFITMFIFSPIIKAINFIRKRKMLLAPATVQKGRYEIVLAKIQKALKDYNIDAELVNTSIVYKVPTRLLDVLSGSLFKDIFIKNEKLLYNKDLEIYIHYEDIMIVGKEDLIKKARAIIADVLMFDTTYLTWDEKTKELEDSVLTVYSDFIISGGTAVNKLLQRLEQIKQESKEIVADFNDLETLSCQILMLENMLLKYKYK